MYIYVYVYYLYVNIVIMFDKYMMDRHLWADDDDSIAGTQ